MEPAKTAQVSLKPSLYFEWQGSDDSTHSVVGIAVVVGNKTFQAIPRVDEKVPLTFTAQNLAEESQEVFLLSPQERRELRLFAMVCATNNVASKVQEIVERPILMEIPNNIEHQDCCARIVSSNGMFKATLEPEALNSIFIPVRFVVFDAMYGAFKAYFGNPPESNYNHAIMAPAFERCCKRALKVVEMQSFIRRLESLLPPPTGDHEIVKKASPPIIELTYHTLGKVNMQALMYLLIRTSYAPQISSGFLDEFPRVFSLFASVFDQGENNIMNLFLQYVYFLKVSKEMREYQEKGKT